MKAERRFNFSAIAAVELSKAGENTMGEDDPNSSQSSSIRDEDTASESGSDTEAETLLSSHSHEEATAQRDIEQTAGMLKEKVASGNFQFLVWTCINTLATIVIVFTNKQIFKDHHLRSNQSTFAAFHFAITAITLYYASQRSLFEPRRADFVAMLPLGIAMCMNVVLPNLSLAYSSVAFYQIARVLLTPTVAVIHFVVYGARIPKQAVYCLIPICLGVAIVSHYDTQSRRGTRVKSAETTPAGVVFALGGVVASSLYTVWIETYRKKFEMNSMQLLFNQAPISAFLLLYTIPFTDQMPDWTTVALSKWILILISGLMAALLNISQFFIVAGAGPVSSTVVGHLKTCSIVALGWSTGRRSTSDRGIFGIFMALTGIVIYSIVMYQHKHRQNQSQVAQETVQINHTRTEKV